MESAQRQIKNCLFKFCKETLIKWKEKNKTNKATEIQNFKKEQKLF